ncbi:tRNA:m(4)X modification enzyme TRM13 homolog [Linum perenne]
MRICYDFGFRKDLNLKAVESMQGNHYLAIGKHLSGPATDLTLRCCLPERDSKDATEQAGKENPFLEGFAIATCCHHLCQWKHYINKEFMLSLGISKEEFHAITWFTSWPVDGDHGAEVSIVIMGRRTHVLFVIFFFIFSLITCTFSSVTCTY